MSEKKGTFMWAVGKAKEGIITKRESKNHLIKLTKFGTPKFQRQDGAKNYMDFEFDDYFATDYVLVEEPKKTLWDKKQITSNGKITNFSFSVEDVNEFIKGFLDEFKGCDFDDSLIATAKKIFGKELVE